MTFTQLQQQQQQQQHQYKQQKQQHSTFNVQCLTLWAQCMIVVRLHSIH